MYTLRTPLPGLAEGPTCPEGAQGPQATQVSTLGYGHFSRMRKCKRAACQLLFHRRERAGQTQLLKEPKIRNLFSKT